MIDILSVVPGKCIDCGSQEVLADPRTQHPSKRCPDCFWEAISEALLLVEAEVILTTGKYDTTDPQEV